MKEWTIEKRYEKLQKIKKDYTKLKREIEVDRDIDDWGMIPGIDFHFIPESNRSDGNVMGVLECGMNFRKFLQEVPLFVNKYSSLLGGYTALFIPYVNDWDPDMHWTHLSEEINKYDIIDGIDECHHFSVDFHIGLKLGFAGLIDKINTYKEQNSDPKTPKIYKALEQVVLGIQDWIRRHIEQAKKTAEVEEDEDLKKILLNQIDVNERIIDAPPSTFRQAVQWINWYAMATRVYNANGALGKIDQILYPYYKQDKSAGILTDEEATFDLACLNYCDTQYMQVGGIDSDGNDATNELSFLVLDAVHNMGIAANISVGCHKDMDETLFDKAVRQLFIDRNGTPRLYSVDNVVAGYNKTGIPIEDCRLVAQTGCHWCSIPGKAYTFNDVIKINFAKVFDVAMHEMMGDVSDYSVELLFDYFKKHLKAAVDVVSDGIDFHMAHKHTIFPELVLDLCSHDVIEKGQDASNGGLQYNYIGIDGAGLGTVADSFAAIQQRVEEEKRITWSHLFRLIDKNYERNHFAHSENLRMMLKNVPSFGRVGTIGDQWAKKIVGAFNEFTRGTTKEGWGRIPGLFSWADTMRFGKNVLATPNGRKAYDNISFGANPDSGEFKGSGLTPTSVAKSIALIQPGFGNAAPLQLDLDPGSFMKEEDIDEFKEMLRTHFSLGGTLINANVVNKEDILEAYHDREKFPDLIVRVTGFSAYFASLSPEFRKLVYNRIVHIDN